MNRLLILPILIPFATAAAGFLLRNRAGWRRMASMVGAAGLTAASGGLFAAVWTEGILSVQLGGWPAPFGITFVADAYAASMVLIASIVGLAVHVQAPADAGPSLERKGMFALSHVLVGSVCGAFLTGDIFNLYVWFEVMLMSSFGLMVMEGRTEQITGGVTYVTLSLISTVLFLCAVSLLYGVTGALNMAHLHRAAASADAGTVATLSMLFLVAFGMKAAVFPLFFWLPASYHTPPASISALFAGLLTKVGVYALVRIFTLVFYRETHLIDSVLLVLAGLTMITGVLGAFSQNEIRKILSFHIVSQIGYMILGLGLRTPLALGGILLFMVHNILAKTNLFLVSGVVNRVGGSYELRRLGGLYRGRLGLSLLFAVSAASLAGFPPFAGFWAKFVLIRECLVTEHYVVAAAAVAVSLVTMLSMVKIWSEAFWKARPEEAPDRPPPLDAQERVRYFAPIMFLAALIMMIGLWPEPFLAVVRRVGAELTNPGGYAAAVLEGTK